MWSQRLLHNRLRKAQLIRWHLQGAIPVSVPWKNPGYASETVTALLGRVGVPLSWGLLSRHSYTYVVFSVYDCKRF